MSSCNDLMCDLDIKNRSEYKKWAVKGGHPDKGGSTSVFQDVNNCVEKDIYCLGKKSTPPPPKEEESFFGSGASWTDPFSWFGSKPKRKSPKRRTSRRRKSKSKSPPKRKSPKRRTSRRRKSKSKSPPKRRTSRRRKSPKRKTSGRTVKRVIGGRTRTIRTGSRGGKYYMSKGRKVYVRR